MIVPDREGVSVADNRVKGRYSRPEGVPEGTLSTDPCCLLNPDCPADRLSRLVIARGILRLNPCFGPMTRTV
jgi:hypothetical protein